MALPTAAVMASGSRGPPVGPGAEGFCCVADGSVAAVVGAEEGSVTGGATVADGAVVVGAAGVFPGAGASSAEGVISAGVLSLNDCDSVTGVSGSAAKSAADDKLRAVSSASAAEPAAFGFFFLKQFADHLNLL